MYRRTLTILVLLGLLGVDPSVGQVKKLKKVFQRSTPEERQERARVRAMELAEELYRTDEDFRANVDNTYRDILGAHAREAYRTNTAPASEVVVIREDRFRRHPYQFDADRDRHILYDNLMIQAYVNRLGQSLVPSGSTSLYAFRLVVHPVPFAKTLATGTIYLSTGLVAMLENEAQLAYVLAHEMAHVYLEHWKDYSLLVWGSAEYLERQEKKRAWKMLGAGIAGAVIGHQIDDEKGGAIGAMIGAGMVALMQPKISLGWEAAQEDEADELAFQVLQGWDYDTQEIRTLYANLEGLSSADTRATLGFLGEPARLKERLELVDALIAEQNQMDDDPYATLLIDTRRFKELMAELRRDNGIQALYFDMFYMARENLREAVEIRSNDPTALYYYGKVLELLGRTEEELAQAKSYFQAAAANDHRGMNFGAHLHHAMTMMGESADPATVEQASMALQAYIESYSSYQLQQELFWQLPPHLDTLFDYMALSGQAEWAPKLPKEPPAYSVANSRGPRSRRP